jgi:hypothetical protein
MLIDFPVPHIIHRRSVNPGSVALAFAGGALSDAERSSRGEVIPDFRPGVRGGCTAYRPSDEPWRSAFF